MTTSTTTDVHVRDAAEADVPFLVDIMFAAQRSQLDRGILEYLLGESPATTRDFLARIVVTGEPHMFHVSRFRIAEVDGTPAAALCTFDRDAHGQEQMMAAMVAVLPQVGLDPTDPEGWRRSAVIQTGFPQGEHGPDGPRLGVENVATLPPFRRRGLISALFADVVERAAADRYPAVQVGCFLGNAPARAAYLDAGFDVVAVARSEDWTREIGCDGTELLVRDLTSS